MGVDDLAVILGLRAAAEARRVLALRRQDGHAEGLGAAKDLGLAVLHRLGENLILLAVECEVRQGADRDDLASALVERRGAQGDHASEGEAPEGDLVRVHGRLLRQERQGVAVIGRLGQGVDVLAGGAIADASAPRVVGERGDAGSLESFGDVRDKHLLDTGELWPSRVSILRPSASLVCLVAGQNRLPF